MTPRISIRRATTADADRIARVHIQSWRETYAHLLPEHALDDLDQGERSARWSANIENPASEVWVALDDGDVIGWASAGQTGDDDAPSDLELTGMYVIASHHGTGAGQALLDRVLGARDAYLWVAAENARATSFYRKNGFTPDGTVGVAELAGNPVATRRLARRHSGVSSAR